MKLKKRILSVVACIVIIALLLPSTLAFAKSLAASFSGSTNIYVSRVVWSGTYWRKSCTAKTNGYSGRHYVRAYIGGSNSSANGAWADTGRCYSNGDITRTARTGELFQSTDDIIPIRFYFPTGYAKYGTG